MATPQKKRMYGSDKMYEHFMKRWKELYKSDDPVVTEFADLVKEAYPLTKKGSNMESPLRDLLYAFNQELELQYRHNWPYSRSLDPPEEDWRDELIREWYRERDELNERKFYVLIDKLKKCIVHLKEGRKRVKRS
jgi:hypothetical protein